MNLENACGIGEIPEEFAHIPTLSPSRLYDFRISPKHYKHVHIDGNKKDTAAMAEGKMVHLFNLEPDKFPNQYKLIDEDAMLVTVDDLKKYAEKTMIDLKGCKKKEDYENTILFHDPNAPILSHVLKGLADQKFEAYSPKDQVMLEEIRREAQDHNWLGKAMQGGTYEQLMWFYDDFAGIIWRFKPDYFHQALGRLKIPCVIDWKKIPRINPAYFNTWLWSSGNYIQMGIYKEGLKRIFGIECSVVIAAYTTLAPYGIEAFEVDDAAVEAGWKLARKKSVEFIQCFKENKWPLNGRGNLLSGTLPTYAFNQLQYDEDEAIEA